MRICFRLKSLDLFGVFLMISLFFLIFRYNKDFSKELSTFDKTIDQSVDSSKWKVLSDGTVVHLTHFSEDCFTRISFDINNNICEDFSNNSLKLLVLIESKSDNFDRRQSIRETWANKQTQVYLNFRVVFLLGLHPNPNTRIQNRIESESKEFADILQINITENFKNLTFKSVAGLHWLANWCSAANFYFKTDDDIFIETNNLIQSLKVFQNSELSQNSILCHKNRNREIIRSFAKISQIMRSYRHSMATNRMAIIRVLRDKISKYKINFSELPGLYFPHYCSGFSYAMSASVAKRLHSTALTIPYFMIEDVFVTGFCRLKANIDIKDTKHLTLWPLVRPSDGKCVFSDHRINSNELSIEEIRLLWQHIQSNTSLCDINESNVKQMRTQ